VSLLDSAWGVRCVWLRYFDVFRKSIRYYLLAQHGNCFINHCQYQSVLEVCRRRTGGIGFHGFTVTPNIKSLARLFAKLLFLLQFLYGIRVRLAKSIRQNLADLDSNIQPNHVGKFNRPHRHTEFNCDAIYCSGRDTFFHREHCFGELRK